MADTIYIIDRPLAVGQKKLNKVARSIEVSGLVFVGLFVSVTALVLAKYMGGLL